jgi:hypothetical protein
MAFGIDPIQGMEAKGPGIRLALGAWHWFVQPVLYMFSRTSELT